MESFLTFQLYSFFEDDDYVYLVLELCPNGDLQKYLKNRGRPMSEEEGLLQIENISCFMFRNFDRKGYVDNRMNRFFETLMKTSKGFRPERFEGFRRLFCRVFIHGNIDVTYNLRQFSCQLRTWCVWENLYRFD